MYLGAFKDFGDIDLIISLLWTGGGLGIATGDHVRIGL